MSATLPEEMHALWHRYVDRVNEVTREVFGEDTDLVMVIGAQWGDYKWGEDGNPECLLVSNLPLCLIPDACADMVTEAERLHEEQHGDGMQPDGSIRQRVTLDALPQEAQAAVREYLAHLGVSEDEVMWVQQIDASDLASLPETDEPEG